MTLERIRWGGERRERSLKRRLGDHYRSLFRRQWELAEQPPHFYDHRIGAFELFAGTGSPFPYYRGYFAAEVIRDGDRLLDIGCGEGFFDKRFFAPRCSMVDAVDIEPSAIEQAQSVNADPKINYVLMDAVTEPFPSDGYDVIVWDGALGHFAAETTERMLEKIAAALEPDGAFVGSESLGAEGSDHLQFFAELDDLGRTFAPHFSHVDLRSIDYRIASGMMRREGFWRCANDPARLEAAAWQRHAPAT